MGHNYARHEDRPRRKRKGTKSYKDKFVTQDKQDAVLEAVKSFIGKPCPTNGVIGEITGLGSNITSNALTALYHKKILGFKIESRHRTIFIIETGESTLPGSLRKSPQEILPKEPLRVKPATAMPDGVWYRDCPIAARSNLGPLPRHLLSLLPKRRASEPIPERFRNYGEVIFASASA